MLKNKMFFCEILYFFQKELGFICHMLEAEFLIFALFAFVIVKVLLVLTISYPTSDLPILYF